MERPEEPRARRLRHQHRPPAGQGRRPAAARGRRGPGRGAARPAGHRRGRRRRSRASSTSPSPRARWGKIAVQAVTAGAAYGRTDALAGQKLNLEFVSANPTGPVHPRRPPGGPRSATRMARLLEASGADVSREYYVNDAGAQIERFARSLQAVALGRPVPEDGYQGDYVEPVAQRVLAESPGLLDLPEEEQLAVFAEKGVAAMVADIRSHARRLRRRTSTPSSPSGRCTSPAPWRRRWRRCASRGTSSSATARSGCGRRTSATTRTACWSRPTASRPTSPPTAPTTWTSGPAASTRS